MWRRKDKVEGLSSRIVKLYKIFLGIVVKYI